MSCDGTMIGSPLAGESTLFDASINVRASICASSDSGTCTAIWSPSKSALNAAHTSGCSWIALPSISTGSKAWIPRRCRVDALAEQILAEAPALALDHVGERLERALVGPGHRLAAAAVVEQRIDRLLQHALLVAHDDFRCF